MVVRRPTPGLARLCASRSAGAHNGPCPGPPHADDSKSAAIARSARVPRTPLSLPRRAMWVFTVLSLRQRRRAISEQERPSPSIARTVRWRELRIWEGLRARRRVASTVATVVPRETAFKLLRKSSRSQATLITPATPRRSRAASWIGVAARVMARMSHLTGPTPKSVGIRSSVATTSARSREVTHSIAAVSAHIAARFHEASSFSHAASPLAMTGGAAARTTSVLKGASLGQQARGHKATGRPWSRRRWCKRTPSGLLGAGHASFGPLYG